MTRPWARVLVATLLASTGVVAIAMRAPSVEVAEVDARSFSADALVRPPAVVDCTLDNGNAARCVQVVVKYLPANLRIGPFCPSMVSEAGGIWNWDGPRAGLYRVDGDFLRMLQGLGYAFYDPHGRVHIADPGKGCPAAANACLEAALDTTVTMTILLPQTPVMATRASRLGVVNKVGLGLDGVPIFSDAPSVLLKGHMPALDTCGGHVDPGGWYHWHSTSSDMKTVYDRSPRQRGLWPSPVARGPVRLWLRRRADLWQRRPRPNDPHQSGCLQRSRRPDGSATGGHVSLPCHAPLSEPAGLSVGRAGQAQLLDHGEGGHRVKARWGRTRRARRAGRAAARTRAWAGRDAAGVRRRRPRARRVRAGTAESGAGPRQPESRLRCGGAGVRGQ